MQYIHKPTEVEAIQLTRENFDEVVEFIGSESVSETNQAETYIQIKNEEGYRDLNAGDYVIRSVLGKIYPCSKEVFEESYSVKE